ncbi:Hypothetical_protein [Hexamita inflata]|uniref:Hypothetical_protein n=1 Tax=Hexamita inflata TaxID=28002 RepID=A0AA86U6K5_9EUKA|nr:Hypothetical protein HINF_LOCUS32475 [Hexamita inflata]
MASNSSLIQAYHGTQRDFAVKQKHYQTETVNGQPITCTPIIIEKDTTVHPESLAALRQVGIEEPWLYQQVGILMSNYREQTDYVFRKKTRKAQDQPTELNIQEIDQTEEFSSIPVNETTNSNAGTQNSSIRPKKKPRQKSQVQHSQEIQAQMNTQTQPPQVTHNTDNTQTNQGAINIQKQVVVNNFNCSNTSLSGQSKSQSTNKSEVARKSQNQQNPKQTAPKQVSQTKTPVQKPKEAPQAPLPQETKKTQSQIPLVKSKHTSETSSQSSTVSSGTQASECNITIEVEAQASELRRHWEDVDPKEYQEQAAIWQKLLTFTLKTTQSRRLVRFNPTQYCSQRRSLNVNSSTDPNARYSYRKLKPCNKSRTLKMF